MKREIIKSYETSDGEGVKIFRSLGQNQGLRLDPFLMLDEFCSDNPDDYIGGFPSHPHRGFETFTYMIDGYLQHKDSLGNSGELKSGEMQWMTAGSGIVHSEMPLQKDGLMRGFQLWVNLPAKEKMKSPKYRDIKSKEMVKIYENNVSIILIAGNYKNKTGPINGLSTELDYMDIVISKGKFKFTGSSIKNYFIYVFQGEIYIDNKRLIFRNGICFSGDIQIKTDNFSRFLLIGGKPINEPIFQYGPFVMNTKFEILKTIEDFNLGKFGKSDF
tara:strand:+ start:877 stop:1695 length:819 start_codon:yes stop_codon:yes gene_type:complete